MITKFPIKRLFRVALLSSTAIGLITMGPVYAVVFSFGIINLNHDVLLELIALGVTGISLIVFMFWTVNIFLTWFLNKFSRSTRKKIARYFWSYIICFMFFLIIRFLITHVFFSEIARQQMLDWKIREFGIHADKIGLLPNRDGFVPYLIMFFMVISINTIVLIIQGLVLLLEKKTIIESENTQLKIKNIEATNQQ